MHTKNALLNRAIQKMYEVISFSEGEEPDWEAMKHIFLPNARLTRMTPEGVDHFDLDTFQAMAQEMLDNGVYTSFYEYEIARRADIFGAMAHVLSVYETKKSATASGFLARGVNSIQLLWSGHNWRVLHLLWDEETGKNPLDLHQVFAGEVLHGQNA